MKRSWRILLLVIALALLGLALWNRSVIFTYLVEPITHLLWLVVRTFLVVDPAVYWALLMAAAVYIGLRMIPEQREHPQRPADVHPNGIEDRPAYWDALLRNAENSANGRLALQRELENLNQSLGTLAEGNGEQEISLPPVTTGLYQGIRAAVRQHILSRFIRQRNNNLDKEFEQSVALILSSMETKLERNNDRSADRSKHGG